MEALLNNPTFHLYVGAVIVLSLNLMGLANASALTRAQAGEAINPEDKKFNASANVVFEGGNDLTARYSRAHRNALENVPLFMITSLMLPLVGTSATVAGALYGVYVLARISHSFCYVKAIQPARTASFALAALAQVIVLGVAGYAVFTA